MMRNYLIPTIIFLLILASCQKATMNDEEVSSEYFCLKDAHSDKTFSFSKKIHKVQVVNYKYVRQHSDFSDSARKHNIDINILDARDKINFKEFLDLKELSQNQIESLRKIIFGYDTSQSGHIEADCYWPKHCIHFLDENETVVGYIEICFDCTNSAYSNAELRLRCNEQYDDLKQLFKEIGLKELTDERDKAQP